MSVGLRHYGGYALGVLAMLILPRVLYPVLALAVCLSGQTRLTRSEIDRWMTELSNWGRWGKDDQLGAIFAHDSLER